MKLVLVKNYHTEGLLVCGVTEDEMVAKAWQQASSECDYVACAEYKVDGLGISPQKVIDRSKEQA